MAIDSIDDLSRRQLLTRSAVLAALLALAGATLLRDAVAKAQDHPAEKVYRLGFLRAGPPPKTWVEALQQGLRERGYTVGQNVVIEFDAPTAARIRYRSLPKIWCDRKSTSS